MIAKQPQKEVEKPVVEVKPQPQAQIPDPEPERPILYNEEKPIKE